MPGTILIWSNRPAFQRAMRSLAHREGLEIVGIARSPQAALAAVERAAPRVVLVDRQTEQQHPDVVLRLALEGPRPRVVAMDLGEEAAVVFEGRRAPAATIRELLEVIQAA